MRRTLLLAAALMAAIAVGGELASAQAPSPGGGNTVNMSALSGLPADVQGSIASALATGNSDTIAAAISAAVTEYPDLAVLIAQSAAAADPAQSATVAGAATKAAMAINPSPGTAAAIAGAVTQADPALAAQIAVSVYVNMPGILQNDADKTLILNTVIASLPVQDQNEAPIVTAALNQASAGNINLNLTNPNIVTFPTHTNPQPQGTQKQISGT